MADHSFRQKIAISITLQLIFTTPAWAQDALAIAPPSPADRPARAAEFADKVWKVATTVLERHIEPPARQEMLLSAIRGLLKAAGHEAPHELSRKISAQSAEGELKQSLAGAWQTAEQANVDAANLEAAAIDGLLGTVAGRPAFLNSKEFAVQQQLSENRYVGIGIALAMDREQQLPFIGKALRRGPLHRAGGQDRDRILAVDGRQTAGLKLEQVVDLLRGPEGTTVTVELRAPEAAESRTLEIVRGVVPLETVVGVRQVGDNWEYRVEPDSPIGYLRFEGINPSTLLELRQASQRIYSEGIRALILDLRNQPGGSAHHAAIVADALLPVGKIGRLRSVEGTRDFESQPDHLFSGWPIAVLVNRGTRAEAEWLAAALQDNQRATIVGEQTSGDAYVTELIPLPDIGGVTLRVGVLERADGRVLQSSQPAGLAMLISPPNIPSPAHDGGVTPDHSVAGPKRPPHGPERSVPTQGLRAFQEPYVAEAMRLLHAALKGE